MKSAVLRLLARSVIPPGGSAGAAPMPPGGPGLSAWRGGDYGSAADSFEEVATSSDSSSWTIAAGAFWAARARLYDRQPDAVTRWLGVAADYPETFYGLLARRILDLPMPFRWALNAADEAALQALNDSSAGQQAVALIEAGETARAEQVLRTAAAQGRSDVAHGAMIMAETVRHGRAGVSPAAAARPLRHRVPRRGLSDPALAAGRRLHHRPGADLRADAPGIRTSTRAPSVRPAPAA